MRAKYIIAPPLLLICLTSNAFSEENMNFLSQENKEFETPIPGRQIIVFLKIMAHIQNSEQNGGI